MVGEIAPWRNGMMEEPEMGTSGPQPRVEIVLPVLNERAVLESSVSTLVGYLGHHCPYPWSITIADNGSTDGTWEIAQRLANAYDDVRAFRLEQRGRGLALRTAWLQSTADIVAYMDIDLSTGLEAFLPLIAPLASGEQRVAIGSRLLPDAQVTRGAKRELISRCYNALIHLLVPHRFSDAQCGFKALHRSAARELVPRVENNRWFFDTELLLLAEEHGERIHEVPVRWVEDRDTRVHIGKTAWEDIQGLLRVRIQRWQRRFGAVQRGTGTALPAHK
jgi:glycosyltransferase involved in cell wall biosynthesis